MEKERRVKALSIVALLVAIAGLTIAFAAMSRLLTINGTASVGKFDVHFEANSEFHGQGQIYEFTGTDGVTDATIDAGEDGTAEIIDGITVNNLKAQFDRTGDDSKATFKLYIVNDSNRIAYVNSINYGSDCNSSNSIQCSLKDENGAEISTSTNIAAHGNMFVFLEVVAPDSVGSNTADSEYNMQVQVTFSQDPVSQGGGNVTPDSTDDPITVDGDGLTYPISGTLDNGVTYQLTSDGDIIVGGLSTIDLDSVGEDDISDDIINEYNLCPGHQGLCSGILRNIIFSGDDYEEVVEETAGDTEVMQDEGLTSSELYEMTSSFESLVGANRAFVFDDGVTEVTTQTSFSTFPYAISTVKIPSSLTTYPNWTQNGDKEPITVEPK